MRDIEDLRRRLLVLARPGGGWPYYAGRNSRIEPTAWGLLALGATGHDAPVLDAAFTFLNGLGRQSGLLVDPGAPAANAAWNGLLVVALHSVRDPRAGEMAAALGPALTALYGIALRPDTTVRQDNTLQAWPWTDGTFSWVEPTAFCTLALKQARTAGNGTAARVAEAERLLLDRACQPAGWNYGNGAVLAQDLRPYVPTTALALLALQDRGGEPVVRRSTDWLAANAASEPSAMALSLAAVCLTVLGPPADKALEALVASERRTGFLDNAHLMAMALFAFTLAEHGGRAFRV